MGGPTAARALGRRVLVWCDRWNADHPWDHNAHYHRWILRRLPPRAARALDVGCGTGDLARRLADRHGAVLGIDVDPTAIDLARGSTPAGVPISFRVQDVMALHDRAGYDSVTAVAVLHHMPFAAALRRLRWLLAPGGTLVVLGLYQEDGPGDRVLGMLAIPANLASGWLHARRRRRPPRGREVRPVSMTARTVPATMPLNEIRSVAAEELPGCRIRRHLFWRYSLTFTQAA